MSAFVLDERFGLGSGFDRWDSRVAGGEWSRGFVIPERPGPATVAEAVRWLASGSGPELRLRPPLRAARALPAAGRRSRRGQEHPYHGEVAAADAALEPLLRPLLEQGRRGRTLVILTSDHGESLGEHGESTHGVFAYEPTLRVPLVVYAPALFRPRVVDGAGAPRGPRADRAGRAGPVPSRRSCRAGACCRCSRAAPRGTRRRATSRRSRPRSIAAGRRSTVCASARSSTSTCRCPSSTTWARIPARRATWRPRARRTWSGSRARLEQLRATRSRRHARAGEPGDARAPARARLRGLVAGRAAQGALHRGRRSQAPDRPRREDEPDAVPVPRGPGRRGDRGRARGDRAPARHGPRPHAARLPGARARRHARPRSRRRSGRSSCGPATPSRRRSWRCT